MKNSSVRRRSNFFSPAAPRRGARRKAQGSSDYRRPASKCRFEKLEARALLDGAGVTASLLKDLNTAPASLNPASITQAGQMTFFVGTDPVHGAELWKTEGTAAGTMLVKDVKPGPSAADPVSLTSINGELFFGASSDSVGPFGADQLWKSDGTNGGTVLVKDLGAAGRSNAADFTDLNGTLVFATGGGRGDGELWSSDGTAAGTLELSEFSGKSVSELTTIAGTLYFAVDTAPFSGAAPSAELWKTDGTAAGTSMVTSIPIGTLPPFSFVDTSIQDLSAVNGRLYFSAYDTTYGRELWTSDGTSAGTQLVADINPGTSDSGPSALTSSDGALYFTADDGVHGRELWTSDGTAVATHLVSDINPGAAGSTPSGLLDVGGTLFFSADDGAHGMELWKSDGTAIGTSLVEDILPGADGSALANLTNVNGTLFFSADDGTHGAELWKSDGSASGTVLVQDINSGVVGSNPTNLANVSGTLYFGANDGAHDIQLWKTDDGGGARLVAQASPPTASSSPLAATLVGDDIYFEANAHDQSAELWKTDGTSTGTVLLGETSSAGARVVNVGGSTLIYNVNGHVLFSGPADATSSELWTTDGTAAGTKRLDADKTGLNPSTLVQAGNAWYYVAEIAGALGTREPTLWKTDGTVQGTIEVDGALPTDPTAVTLSNLTNLNGALFFVLSNAATGETQLWKTNGTASGTAMVQSLGSEQQRIDAVAAVDGTLFVSDEWYDPTASSTIVDLWASDGSAIGTHLLKEVTFSASQSFSAPERFAAINGKVVFGMDDGVHGNELWSTDGTPGGTQLLDDIVPGSGGSDPSQFTLINGKLLFEADGGLWATDGADAQLLKPLSSARYGTSSYDFTNVNGAWYFSADDGAHGLQLWKTDGTPDGTVMVTDVNPNEATGGFWPQNLLNANGVLLFSADDGVHGRELWMSNGTSAGTVLAQDILPGADGSNPAGLTGLVHGKLFFSAADNSHGFEPWILSTSWVVPPIVYWTGGGDGKSWSDPANWSGDAVPGAWSDVVIDVPGDVTVVHDSGTDKVNSLSSAEAFTLSGGTLTVATTIEVDNTFTFSGGTLANATVKPGTGGQGIEFTYSGGALDGVTVNADLDLTQGLVTITNGLTLNGTARLGDANYYGRLYFSGTQTLAGNGSVLFGAMPSNGLYVSSGNTLTVGAGITIHGQSGSLAGGTILNQGAIAADGGGGRIDVIPATFINEGTLNATGGETFAVRASLNVHGSVAIASSLGGTISVSGDLLGDTQATVLFNPQGTLLFNGTGGGSPQRLEAMSKDVGAVAAGFKQNFALGALALGNAGYVKLVDLSHNSTKSGAEAVYARSVIVPAGATLDLGGLNLYARAAQVDGTVIGGNIQVLPDSGPLALASPTPGAISPAGQVDEWQFFDRGGRSVSVLVDPGSGGPYSPVAPALGWAEAQLLDSNGTVLADGSNNSQGGILTLDDVLLPADGTYRIRVFAPSGHSGSTGDYVVAAWDVTPNVRTLNLNEAATGAVATPFAIDRWNFSAAAGNQIRFDLLNASSSAIEFDLDGPAGFTAFHGLKTSSDVITLPSSGAYTLTAHGSGGATGTYAFKLNQTTQLDLPLGTTEFGTLAGSGQPVLYRVHLLQPASLLVSLNDSTTADRNELYAKFGAPPTRADYDYRYSAASSANQQVLVPKAAPGDWYVLLYGASIPSPSNYTIEAVATEIELTGITPDRGGNSAPATLTISGAGFDANTTVSLVASDSTVYPAGQVEVDSPTQITAAFVLPGMPPGTYAVRVSNPALGSSELAGAFTVVAGGAPHLETHLVVPSTVGFHAAATIYVEYANTGDVAMPAPLLVLTATQNGVPGALLTLDATKVVSGFWTSANPAGYGQSVQILASGATPGVLQPGESLRVPVYYAGWLHNLWDFSRPPLIFSLGVVNGDDTSVVDWSSLKDGLRPASIASDAWDAIYPGLTAQMGDTWGDYVKRLDTDASYLGRLGENVTDISKLWQFEIAIANGLGPLPALSVADDLYVAAPGLSLDFGRSFGVSLTGRYRQGIFGRGWSTPWETSLSVASDGTVTIAAGDGSLRTFQPDTRPGGGYFSQPGDSGTLSLNASGDYLLRELDGVVTAFHPDGRLDYVEDANGNRITAGYIGAQLTTLTHSSGQFLTIEYNAAGHVDAVTSSDGRQVTYAYDSANGHLSSVTSFDGRITQYAYSAGNGAATEHALTSVAFGDSTHRYFTYDAQGRLTSTYLDDNAEPLKLRYPEAGEVDVTDGTQGVNRLFFDARGLLVKTLDALSRATYATFDDNLNLTQFVDASGLPQSFRYDDQGNLVSYTDALHRVVQMTYAGPFDQLSSLTDGNGHTTRFSYDPAGNLTATIYADSSVENAAYDPLGNASSFTNRRGDAIGYSYNNAGQVARESFADGTHVDFSYDAHGNLISAADSTGTTTFDYDAGDHLTKVAYPDGRSLLFTYDAGGRRIAMVDQPGFTVRYRYDSAGRLSGLSDVSGNSIVAYSYDAAGRLSRKDLGNGTYTTYERDAAGQLLHLVNYAPNGTVNSRFDYTYDELGRRIGMGTLDGQWTYSYDADGELVHAVFASANAAIPNQDLQYAYDSAGNRTSTTINGVTTNYASNSVNEYVSVGSNKLAYDADGNLTSDGNAQYYYDDQGHLVKVVTPTDTWTYEYDPFGHRVATVHNDQRTEFLVDPTGIADVTATYDGSGNVVAHYAHGLGLVSQTTSYGNTAYYDFDATGSTAGISGASGGYVDHYTYAPFGQPLEPAIVVGANPYQFAGQLGVMTDGSGIGFAQAAGYVPELGSFANGGSTAHISGASAAQIAKFNNGLQQLSWGLVGIGGIVLFAATAPVGLPAIAIVGLGINTFLAAYEIGDGVQNILGSVGIGPASASDASGGPLGDLGGLFGREWRAIGEMADIGVGLATALLPGPRVPNGWKFADSLSFFGGLAADVWGLAGEFMGAPLPGPSPVAATSASAASVTSTDPNELIGPAGYGTPNFISPAGTTFSYRIDFENSASATAPAQQVWISDPLDPNLDPSTFAWTEIGFGDYLVSVPTGSQHFETTVDVTENGHDFEVEIEAGIDLVTDKVFVRFTSIDPATQLPPDVLTGFLPPEDGTGRGMGHVSYVVAPRPGLLTGAQIRSVASITFDANPPITTDQIDPNDPSQGHDPAKQALVTIDSAPPSSTVTPIQPVTRAAIFHVSWSGTDDHGGAGISTFDVYVSENEGPYQPFVTHTIDHSANFTGQNGHTYRFYSVATDNAGNRQDIPSAAQASTTISAILPNSTVLALPAASPIDFTVAWTGDDTGGPGLAAFDVFVSDNGGPFMPFLTATTSYSATFTGRDGHTYGFYSVAADKLGQRQPTPVAAHASTFVIADKNGRYVAAAFNDVLGRLVDAAGLSHWTEQLDRGAPRSKVADLIDHSAEYFGKIIITPAYRRILGRTPDAVGLAYWIDQMQHHGLTDERLEAGFIGSDEFYQHAGGTDKTWVDAMYVDLLGRLPDAGGETYWVNRLSESAKRSDVAYGFAASLERERQRIADDYMHYLGRLPDQRGLDHWVQLFAEGMTNEDVITGFVASDEYYVQHTR